MDNRYEPMAFSIVTPRLSLHLRGPDDAGSNLELMAERGRSAGRALAEERSRLAEQRAQAQASGIGFLTIRRRVGGEAIGYCGLLVGRCTLDEPEVAYELLHRAQGHGYATEAVRAVVAAGLATGRRRLWATMRPDNTRSLRVLARVAFRRSHSVTDEHGELVYLHSTGGTDDPTPRPRA